MSVLSNGGHTGLREKSSDTILKVVYARAIPTLNTDIHDAHISGLVGEL
jgi:hypothetical protein